MHSASDANDTLFMALFERSATMIDRTIEVSLEDIISNMDITKEQKEELYRHSANLSDSGTVLWENDRIVGFRPHQAIKCITGTITIGDDE